MESQVMAGELSGWRWLDAPEDLKIGAETRTGIDEAIRVHDKLLIVLSANSVRSAWVKKEVETAFEKEQKQNRMVLFPIRLDEAVMETDQAWAADIRRMRNIGDFRTWKNHDEYQKAFGRLMRDLKAGEEREKQKLEIRNKKLERRRGKTPRGRLPPGSPRCSGQAGLIPPGAT